jgi:hypothetical protein
LHAAISLIMNLEERIRSFALLGETLRNYLNNDSGPENEQLNVLIDNQHIYNPWFTHDNVRMALNAIAVELTDENLVRWVSQYPDLSKQSTPIKVGVIMAGNIPLVGFHDFLSVLITGNNLIAKTSSKDNELIIYISRLLCSINPMFSDKIKFTESTLSDFDAVIATGSDNTSRYFDYYFSKYPHIIRKSRNSVAIIEGDETEDEFTRLGFDIFSYYGLGCRNVSKIFFPEGYDFTQILKLWDPYRVIIDNLKYANNYDFNKAVYLVNKETFFDTGYLLLKEDLRMSSPVSVLYYEYYESKDSLMHRTDLLKEKIQCLVSKNDIPFGRAQLPHLWDYADGIDTIEFLLKKKSAVLL